MLVRSSTRTTKFGEWGFVTKLDKTRSVKYTKRRVGGVCNFCMGSRPGKHFLKVFVVI